MNTEELLRQAKAFHHQAGTDVRCPTCNAAEGFFCHVPETKVRSVLPHKARLVLAGILNEDGYLAHPR